MRALRFDSEQPSNLSFTLDDRALKADVKWGKDGQFEATFPAPTEFGSHSLLVRQETPQRELIDGTTFLVRDEDKGK